MCVCVCVCVCVLHYAVHLSLNGIQKYLKFITFLQVFTEEPRIYDRDRFLFLIFILFLVGCVFTIRPAQDKILNRYCTWYISRFGLAVRR